MSKTDFMPRVKELASDRQNGSCAKCGAALDGRFGASAHHKKPRSLLRADEYDTEEKQLLNIVWLCGVCHDAVEKYAPNTGMFRTRSWQEIGQTEED